MRLIRLTAPSVLVVLACSACIQLWGSSAADADRMAQVLNLRAGMSVAEIGAGTGTVAVALAPKVEPAGHVYATEIAPERLAEIRANVAKTGAANITVIEATPLSSGLPENCCDAIFMIGVYHHITDPIPTDQSIVRALKPGGELAIADFPPSWLLKPWTPKGIPANRGGHGVPQQIVKDELTAAGLRFDRRADSWPPGWLDSYCLLFTRLPDALPTAAR